MTEVNNVNSRSFDKNLAHIPPCSPTEFNLKATDNAYCSMYLHPTHGFQWDKEDGEANLMMMSKESALKRITAYIAENKLKEALEAEVKYMVVEANKENPNEQCPQRDVAEDYDDNQMGEWQYQKLDAIYDNEPLGF
ncbi:hypothetical protein KIW84_034853 [Lathyrus oleraceus]|uniref:Uncharacterized protein n=1 Tax=Pisum sativum TaxID=3888 RepID=A0A9D4Y0H5_PEA|nr:hypothetical protein KIW84_034853 [Pisum sativum]